MSQTRKHSFIEACVNVIIGYGIAVTAQIIIFPWFGIFMPIKENLMIGGLFTLVSLARSFFLRRIFNMLTMRNGLTRKR